MFVTDYSSQPLSVPLGMREAPPPELLKPPPLILKQQQQQQHKQA
jgi:hypothetical protein